MVKRKLSKGKKIGILCSTAIVYSIAIGVVLCWYVEETQIKPFLDTLEKLEVMFSYDK